MTRRMDRINDLLREVISQIISTELSDPRINTLVSVTRVETAPDLSRAQVHVSIMGSKIDKSTCMEALRSASGYVRKNLHSTVNLKTIPDLNFCLDETMEQGNQVIKLIEKIKPYPKKTQ